ncbi:hypothetical protein ACFC1R_24655 [Kitasatospora sp. NPDC056138]|uniref:hypothetical protein n=1 Tax=Kitasatospora sp. NPDC056138 TaxID=3345724 RepID=UPI0035D60D2F
MSSAQPPGQPVYDLYAAFPHLTTLRTAVRQQDWSAVSDFFAALDDDDDVATAARTVADTAGADAFLRSAVAERQEGVDAGLARSLLAFRLIRAGWAIRSGYRAQNVSRDQFAQFHDHLRRAEQLLIDAVAMEPGHVLGWYLRLMTCRGLELGQSEARRRYDRLAAYQPHHFQAQGQLLQQLCPKWGGSWKAAHAFGRQCRKNSLPGGLDALITVEAHLERWMELPTGRQHTYWWAEGVQEELTGAAEASVLHPDHRPNMSWIAARSILAAAFSVCGQHGPAAVHFAELGEFAAEYPWDAMSGRPDALLVRQREAALHAAASAKKG